MPAERTPEETIEVLNAQLVISQNDAKALARYVEALETERDQLEAKRADLQTYIDLIDPKTQLVPEDYDEELDGDPTPFHEHAGLDQHPVL